MAEKQLTPQWYPHSPVCKRSGCRAAVQDALTALQTAREQYDSLMQQWALKEGEQTAPVGHRQDAMCSIHLREVWWASGVASHV